MGVITKKVYCKETKEDFAMTLIQLEYFCAVCRYHSITRAARELFVSQPTISVALRELENEFHLRLFNHGKNRISLTHEGEEFYKSAEKLLSCAQEMYTEFDSKKQVKHPIRIGIPPILSTIFFPALLDAFREVSETPVELHEAGSIRAAEMVESEELDAALVNLDFYSVERFNYHVMMKDHYVFCVSKDHRLAGKDAVTFDMVRDEPIILFRTDSVQNRTISSIFNAHGTAPNVILHSSQLYTIESFVKSGTAGAFLYSSIPVSKELTALPIEPEITSRIGVVWKKGTFIHSKTSEFVDFVTGFDMKFIV